MKKITGLYHEYLPNISGMAGWYYDYDTNLLDSKSKAAPFAKKLLLFHAETQEIFTVYEASEQQVISNFAVPEYYQGNLYFLVLEKTTEQILIMSYEFVSRQVTEVARIAAAGINFARLAFYVTPVLLAVQDDLNHRVEIYYPQRLSLPLAEDESFECQEGEKFYFSKWLADESLARRNAYLVKDAYGKTIAEGIGRITRFENGEFMII